MNENCLISLTLPYPPSVNNYWKQGKQKNVRYISEKGVAFINAVRLETVKNKAVLHLTGKLAIVVHLIPGDRRTRDYDNPLKALNDSLIKAGIITDDSQIKDAHIHLYDPDKSVKGGLCRVWLYAL